MRKLIVLPIIVLALALTVPVVAQQPTVYPTPGAPSSLSTVEPTPVVYLTPEPNCEVTGAVYDTSCSPTQGKSQAQYVDLLPGEAISCSGDYITFKYVDENNNVGELVFPGFTTRIPQTELTIFNNDRHDAVAKRFFFEAPYGAGCQRFALPMSGILDVQWVSEQITSLTLLRIQQHLGTGDALDRYPDSATSTPVPNCEDINIVIQNGPQGVDCAVTNVATALFSADGGGVSFPYYGVYGETGFVALLEDGSTGAIHYVDLIPTLTPQIVVTPTATLSG